MRKVEISPSILSADFSKIKYELSLAKKSGAKYIHMDVMDGIFVPKVQLNIEQVNAFSKISKLINDVHIMTINPALIGKLYAKNGADIVTFHYEACENKVEVQKAIDSIREEGCKVGISIKPDTAVEVLDDFISEVDLVLIMSVEPGKGGQTFIESSLEKIRYLRNFIDKHNLSTLIEVDGGINEITAKKCKDAGVDILVAGSYLYGHEDFAERAKQLLE